MLCELNDVDAFNSVLSIFLKYHEIFEANGNVANGNVANIIFFVVQVVVDMKHGCIKMNFQSYEILMKLCQHYEDLINMFDVKYMQFTNCELCGKQCDSLKKLRKHIRSSWHVRQAEKARYSVDIDNEDEIKMYEMLRRFGSFLETYNRCSRRFQSAISKNYSLNNISRYMD